MVDGPDQLAGRPLPAQELGEGGQVRELPRRVEDVADGHAGEPACM